MATAPAPASGTAASGQTASPPTVSLSIRLLREGREGEEALRADHDLRRMPSETGELFIGQNPPNPPGWVEFLSYFSPDLPALLRTQSCAAVLFVEAAHDGEVRSFAISFGQGHHMLDDDAIERGFGLKVVLNTVARDRLRTLDSATLDSTIMQRRVQASRNADLAAFEIDTNRDLLRLASGIPDGDAFAKALAGKDALNLRAALAPGDLVPRCAKALEFYRGTEYRKDFAFIDHVIPVADRVLLGTLDDLTFAALSDLVKGTPSDLHLAIPDILSPDHQLEIGYFGTGLSAGQKTPFLEVSIEDYVAELQRGDFTSIKSMKDVRESHEIRVIVNGEGDRKQRQKLHRCLVFEARVANQTYVLFDGQWFLIETGYHADVEQAYQALLRPSIVQSTTSKNEQQLIAALENQPGLLSIDRTKVSPTGAPGAALEPCDFLTSGSQLIHLKDGHSSAPLSHLWNQGLVSAEAFVRDAKFRNDFRAKARQREQQFNKTGFVLLLPTGAMKVVPTQFPFIFGVMRHPYAACGGLGLPFFSKVALRAVAERLGLMGFGVELHLIRKV